MNAYELLGIERSSDIETIKKAYRQLAKDLHPDVNLGDEKATDLFKRITAAYNMLADAKKRSLYDRNVSSKEKPTGTTAPWEKGGIWYEFEIDETSGERIIDLYGDVAGTRMGRVKGAAATSMQVKGQDVAAKLEITETEARLGTCKLITIMTGLTIAVEVPQQTQNGKTITLPGFGIEGYGGGASGDLNVVVRIIPDPSIEVTKDKP